MEARTIYLETSVIGYATARDVRDTLINSRLELTRRWLAQARSATGWQLYVSDVVVREISAGDPTAAGERRQQIEELEILEITDAVGALSEQLLLTNAVPEKAKEDALHIALTAVHGIEFLVTWNCTHIANATMRRAIEKVCKDAGYEPSIICTPEELTPNEPT
jgi:predicted nucleic acid-binding protein